MPTPRARARGFRAGGPATPVEYAMLGLTAVILIMLVFFALGRLVDDQIDCSHRTDATAAAGRC